MEPSTRFSASPNSAMGLFTCPRSSLHERLIDPTLAPEFGMPTWMPKPFALLLPATCSSPFSLALAPVAHRHLRPPKTSRRPAIASSRRSRRSKTSTKRRERADRTHPGRRAKRSQVMATLGYLTDVIRPQAHRLTGLTRAANEWTRDEARRGWGLETPTSRAGELLRAWLVAATVLGPGGRAARDSLIELSQGVVARP